MKKLASFVLIFMACTFYLQAQSGSIELGSDFSEREIMIHTSSGNIYGTLTIPINNELGTIALVIPDFGLTDRDGNSVQIEQSSPLKMLAEDLAKEGVSTLRIEKREVTENKNSAIVKSGVRIEDMVEDAVRWLRFLKADKRFSKIAVIGHGEGALVGMLASEIADIKYYVSIAGLGSPGYETVEDNLMSQLTLEQMDIVQTYIEEMRKGNMLEDVEPSLASIFNSSIQPYLISWFKYNPVDEIANLKAKVLLIQGTDDAQVNQEELAKLAAAYPQAKEILISGMNHAMRSAKKKEKQHDKTNEQCSMPLATGLVDGIVEFLK